MWRIVEVAYFENPREPVSRIKEAPWPTLVTIWTLSGLCIVFGLATDLTIGMAQFAAQSLLGLI